MLLFLTFQKVFSQDLPERKLSEQVPIRENPILIDSTSVSSDSLQIPIRSDIETTVKYSAKDSIIADVISQIIYLYGEAQVTYGEVELKAERISIDQLNNLLTADFKVDSSGNKVGVPVFTDGGEPYQAQKIQYNINSKKALIKGVVTKQGEAFIHSERVKRDSEGNLLLGNNRYTTCNLEEPHFNIRAKKLKMIPGNKIVSGPFNLEINDIPTPLGFFFGMFPETKKSGTSGIIIPSYGEERRRGFFLRDGGYYFDISEYIKLTVLGEIYSKGSKGFKINTDYKKRYAYNGGLSFNYINQSLGDNEEDTTKVNDFSLNWRHTPQSKGKGAIFCLGECRYIFLQPK